MRRFWSQPDRRYRNFQIIFTLLTANFFFPAVSYLVAPSDAMRNFVRLGTALGAAHYNATPDNVVWRILAVGNVLTLALMCFLLQLNVKRFFPVIIPLVFMKSFSTLANLGAFIGGPSHFPGFLAVFLWDGLAVFLFIYFAGRARASVVAGPEVARVPQLALEGEEAAIGDGDES